VSDLLYNAEELYAGLLTAGLLVEAAAVYEAVTDLRRKVREGGERE
jgi:hypothetical protein